MFRNLCMLRNKLALQHRLVSRLTSRSYVSRGHWYRCATGRSTGVDGVTYTDINVNDLAEGDMEFTRNFLNAVSMDRGHSQEGVEPEVKDETPSVSEPMSIDTETPLAPGVPSSVLGIDGNPIVPIEIDGWNQDDDEDPIVQKNNRDIDIGNDEEYKAQQALRVPEVRQAQTEYKGIKVRLPETANQDVGTYRFRRDPEDKKVLGDDTRLVKFDKE
ncbi:uncharacterized protein [Drosophila bipectinata]|uniref:uncharacterized protein isoform X2 n=1 Tax=Drosophila bipectinata TaxID=42026 RepID=UPI0038B3F71A